MAIKKIDAVTRALEFLEENIDEDHCRETEKLHVEALSFKPGVKLPLSIFCKTSGKLLSNVEAFHNPEAMLHNELIKSENFGNVINSVKIKDDYPLHIRSNHGIVIVHSMVGGVYQLNENATPWALPQEGTVADYRKKWEDKPYDIKNDEVVKKVCATYQYMAERLSEYPKCRRNIRLTHTDMQGPFNIAQNLFGGNFFLELYDNPDDAHWLIGRCAEAIIELFNIIDPLVNNYTEGREAVYIHGGIYPGRVLLKNDTATAMLSEEHYEEFCRPYDIKVSEALGKLSIHYCGASQPFHSRVIKVPNLAGLNFGDPQMQNLDTFLKEWNAQGVAAVSWGQNREPEFLYQSLGDRDVTGFTLCCNAETTEKASELIKHYREKGLKALAA
jgi:hypothetical protein